MTRKDYVKVSMTGIVLFLISSFWFLWVNNHLMMEPPYFRVDPKFTQSAKRSETSVQKRTARRNLTPRKRLVENRPFSGVRMVNLPPVLVGALNHAEPVTPTSLPQSVAAADPTTKLELNPEVLVAKAAVAEAKAAELALAETAAVAAAAAKVAVVNAVAAETAALELAAREATAEKAAIDKAAAVELAAAERAPIEIASAAASQTEPSIADSVEEIEMPKLYGIQVASFRRKAMAQELAKQHGLSGNEVHVVPRPIAGESWYRVILGGYEDKDAAVLLDEILRDELGDIDTRLVRFRPQVSLNMEVDLK